MSESDEIPLVPLPDDLDPPPLSDANEPAAPLDDEAEDPAPAKSRRPTPPLTPGKPLPRISRTAPLTVDEADAEAGRTSTPARGEKTEAKRRPSEAPRPQKDRGRKDRESDLGGGGGTISRDRSKPARARKPDPDDAPKRKGALLEETPEFDTIESRQRARLLLGVGFLGVLGLIILFVVRSFSGGSGAEDAAPPPETFAPSPPPTAAPKVAAETEAGVLLADAESFARAQNEAAAEERLQKILDQYPDTKAAALAAEALERRRKGLPYFVNGPAVVAEKSVREAPPGPTPTVVVEVQPPPARNTEANVRPPDTPPEPRRATGLPVETADIPAKPLPPGFRPRVEAGVHPSGWPNEITGDRDGASMVLVPGGTYFMGRDDGPPVEAPAHQVTLSPFYIDQHEVTVRQYRIYREWTRQPLDVPPLQGKDGSTPPDDAPVVMVSQRDALAYADWAGKQLPTEAQWEFAGRTLDSRRHPWGNDPPRWGGARQPRQLDPVATFADDLSPYGAFDLAGNAWEWTADAYDPKFYKQFKQSAAVNPANPDRGKRNPSIAIRGGAKDWRLTSREGMPAEAHLPYLGFRCALDLHEAAPEAPPVPNAASPHQPGPSAPAARGGNVPF